jgi:hypothetical protein
VRYSLRAVRSVLSDEKKLSIAALSQTLPNRLIEQTTLPQLRNDLFRLVSLPCHYSPP